MQQETQMNEVKRITELKSNILDMAEKFLKRDQFIHLHKNIDKSKLSRVLNQKIPCDDELFDYICQEMGISLIIGWSCV